MRILTRVNWHAFKLKQPSTFPLAYILNLSTIFELCKFNSYAMWKNWSNLRLLGSTWSFEANKRVTFPSEGDRSMWNENEWWEHCKMAGSEERREGFISLTNVTRHWPCRAKRLSDQQIIPDVRRDVKDEDKGRKRK